MLMPFLYLLTSTVSPGPVTVLTIHNTSKYGRLSGISVALGGAAATVLFVVLAFLLTTNRSLGHISINTANYFQQISAVLILLMGLHAGYHSMVGSKQHDKELRYSNQRKQCFWAGFLLMLPHLPAAILFYTVILPQYANMNEPANMVLLMGLVKTILTISWYSALSFAAKPVQKWLSNVKIQRALEFGVACFLIITGITIFI